jgi:hypothetical protein
MRRPRSRRPTGSTLVLVVILLGVLAAIAAAAVTLSSRDRINASAKSRRDESVACARAAQVKIWSEIAKYGTGWLTSTNPVTEFTLPDGTRLGPLHYGQTVGGGLTAKDVIIQLASANGDEQVVDLSNRSAGLIGSSKTYRCVAHCVVPGNLFTFTPDRELEVEFIIRTRI